MDRQRNGNRSFFAFFATLRLCVIGRRWRVRIDCGLISTGDIVAFQGLSRYGSRTGLHTMANNPPKIEPVSNATPRPFWSVMIPTYKANAFLAETLKAVLAQDPGADRMQIAVVDDCSPSDDVVELVRSAGHARVELHRNEQNLGLAGNWSECIRRARGQVVHVLHQDDLIAPGFYDRFRNGLEQNPDMGAAFCRFGVANEKGERTWEAPPEREDAGPLEGWLEKIAVKCRIQCAAIVVRRAVYETLGGYHPDLLYALDWEMWVRIASRFGYWYEPTLGADYRLHGGSETTRLSKSGGLLTDQCRAIELFAPHLPAEKREKLVRGARHECARVALRHARRCMADGEWDLARKLLDQAVDVDPSFATRRRALRLKGKMKITRFWRSIRS